MNSKEYIPGVCNIDTKGRKIRATFGAISITITVVLWAILTITKNTAFYWNLLLALPAMAGFIGIWQANYSFCVADAAKHQHEIGRKPKKITNKDHIKKDKKKATKIYTYSLISTIILIKILNIIGALIKTI